MFGDGADRSIRSDPHHFAITQADQHVSAIETQRTNGRGEAFDVAQLLLRGDVPIVEQPIVSTRDELVLVERQHRVLPPARPDGEFTERCTVSAEEKQAVERGAGHGGARRGERSATRGNLHVPQRLGNAAFFGKPQHATREGM